MIMCQYDHILVTGYDIASGTAKWQHCIKAQWSNGGIVGYGDFVAVGTAEGLLYFLSIETGRTLHTVQFDAGVSPVGPISNGMMYLVPGYQKWFAGFAPSTEFHVLSLFGK